MFTIRVIRPGRESRHSVQTLVNAMAYASEVIIMSRGDLFEISIVDETEQTEVSNYFSLNREWVKGE